MARIFDALRRPPRWMMASRPVNTYVMVGAACLAILGVVGLGEVATLWNDWARLGVYLAYAVVVAWCHQAAVGEQIWQSLSDYVRRENGSEMHSLHKMRWPLSAVTVLTLPVYLGLLLLGALGLVAGGFGLIMGGFGLLLGVIGLFFACLLILSVAVFIIVLFLEVLLAIWPLLLILLICYGVVKLFR